MRGVSGEEYPIGRAIFEQTYTLDTTPQAQRTWVGLTQQETKEIMEKWDGIDAYVLCRAIEAELKEKYT